MTKNTGMNAQHDKDRKTAGLTPAQVKTVNRKIQEEKSDPVPANTIASLNKARRKKQNETRGVMLKHKSLTNTPRGKKSA